jgi:hypothetical protein
MRELPVFIYTSDMTNRSCTRPESKYPNNYLESKFHESQPDTAVLPCESRFQLNNPYEGRRSQLTGRKLPHLLEGIFVTNLARTRYAQHWLGAGRLLFRSPRQTYSENRSHFLNAVTYCFMATSSPDWRSVPT